MVPGQWTARCGVPGLPGTAARLHGPSLRSACGVLGLPGTAATREPAPPAGSSDAVESTIGEAPELRGCPRAASTNPRPRGTWGSRAAQPRVRSTISRRGEGLHAAEQLTLRRTLPRAGRARDRSSELQVQRVGGRRSSSARLKVYPHTSGEDDDVSSGGAQRSCFVSKLREVLLV